MLIRVPVYTEKSYLVVTLKPRYIKLIVYVMYIQFTIASLTFVVVIYIKEVLNFSLRHVVMKFLMKFEEK